MAHKIGREWALVVERPTIEERFTVQFAPPLSEAIPEWGPSTRASPVFALEGTEPPDLAGRTNSVLCFIGPIHPGRIPPDQAAFLTYGLYNVVLVASGARGIAKLREAVKQMAAPCWELWTVQRSKIVSVEFSSNLRVKPAKRPTRSMRSVPEELRSAMEEYNTLISMTESRTAPYLPEVVADLKVFDEALRHQLAKTPLHEISKLQWLININAALSRFSSQTFAGTSPILGIECHFWTHSLLGIGVAARALLQVRRQFDTFAEKADFTTSIEATRKKPPCSVPLKTLKSVDERWNTSVLSGPSPTNKESSQRLPLIVCFSGRDGFKSTAWTISVPLEILQKGNSYAWSFQTLTHEVSHVFVEQIIASYLPEDELATRQWSTRVVQLMQQGDHGRAANLFEELQELLVRCFAILEAERQQKRTISLDDSNLHGMLMRGYPEVSELLAHVFDFAYFYRSEHQRYVNSIWSSWDAIPNIKSRVPEYLIRTLCALHINNISVRDGINVTFGQLKNELTELDRLTTNNQYVKVALAELTDNAAFYREHLESREQLLNFFRIAMLSPETARSFSEQRPESKTARATSSAKKTNYFELNRRIDNPLRFISEAASDRKADLQRALWIITQLAFTEGPHA